MNRIDFRTAARAVPLTVNRMSDRLVQLLIRLGIGEHTLLLAIAALVGVLAGFAIVGFYRLIDLGTALVQHIAVWLSLPEALVTGVMIAAGLAIVRVIIRYGTHDSPGENIPDVMHAVARRGGILKPWPVALKIIAAAITIASGGSVGAEGPVAVLGAGMGSATGQWFNFRTNRLRLLVGCGAAAGISGAFGAPIGGVFFAIEKILGGYRTTSLAAIVVSSVSAAAVTRNLLGADQVIRIPVAYVVRTNSDLAIYALVGLLGGIVSVLYNRGVWRLGDLLGKLPEWWRLLLAAALVGLLSAQFDPALWGRGHQSLDLGAVLGNSAGVLFALSMAKIAATALTLGGGGVGGVFTPALVVGGTFGSAIGVALATLFPQAGIQPVAFGLVGMAAVVAGSAHAPLTAIFIVLEITNDYGLILPLLLAGSLAYVVARRIYPESIYSEWLARRGEYISHGADEAVLRQLTVADAYRSDPIIAHADETVERSLSVLRHSGQLEFPVVDSENVLIGVLTWTDIKKMLADYTKQANVRIRDLASPTIEGVTLDDSLLTALRRLGARDAQLLPVVDAHAPNHLRGVIGRGEIFAAYERELG